MIVKLNFLYANLIYMIFLWDFLNIATYWTKHIFGDGNTGSPGPTNWRT
jgi:hypothetical protein